MNDSASASKSAVAMPEARSIAALALMLTALIGNPGFVVAQSMFIIEPLWLALSGAAGQLAFGSGGVWLAWLSLRDGQDAARWVPALGGAAVLMGVVVIVLAVVTALAALLAGQPTTGLLGG